MRRAGVLLALLLAAAPARAWRLWGEPSDKKIRPVQELSDRHLSNQVIAALSPDFMQTLRGTDLRQAYVLWGDNLDLLGRVDEALGAEDLQVIDPLTDASYKTGPAAVPSWDSSAAPRRNADGPRPDRNQV